MLNQFHDVLPGSGIGIIYPQAEQLYREAMDAAAAVWEAAAQAVAGETCSCYAASPRALNLSKHARNLIYSCYNLHLKLN